MIFIIDFQFQVHLMYLSGCQMSQSRMEPNMVLEHPRRVQLEIFSIQGVYFEYTQLLPGVEMFQLILSARQAPLIGKALRTALLRAVLDLSDLTLD